MFVQKSDIFFFDLQTLNIYSLMHTACFALKVLSDGEYRAEPADIWSCGIVLVAMLAGGKKKSTMDTNKV